MQAMTAAFADALRRPHTVASRVDVVGPDGRVVASTDGGAAEIRLPAIDGEVVVDRAQDWRGRFAWRFSDPDGRFTPRAASDLLSVLSGNELVPWRGLVLPGGRVELKQLGVFGTARLATADSGALSGSLTCHDRSREVDRNRFARPWVVQAGSVGTDAIQSLVLDRRPGTEFRVVASALTLPRLTYDEQTRPWSDAAQEMAASIGYEVFFAYDGVCVIQPVPDPATSPLAYEYGEGAAALSAVERDQDNERAPNYVVVLGENASNAAPVRGSAWDADPSSPTYAGNPEVVPPVPPGAYGLVTEVVVRSDVGSAGQAAAAAQGILLDRKGVPEVVAFDAAAVNPCHEGSDVVRVRRARAGVDADYVLERFSIPLTAKGGPMRATTRERRVA